MTSVVRGTLVLSIVLHTSIATAQVLRLQELNTGQIAALDRTKTVVLLQGGILEEHGPYLPSYTDGYINEYLTAQLAAAIVARPGWSVVMFPPVPLGADTAESLGGRRSFPGSYGVRESTLRAVFVDLTTEIGEQEFRWVFLVDGHGAPAHNRALDGAARYFNSHYQGRMVHLSGIAEVRGHCTAVMERRLSREAMAEDAQSPHGGAWETSAILSLQPALVDPAYRRARPLPAPGWNVIGSVARAKDWPGYFGSPRVASPEAGDDCLAAMSAAYTGMALRVLDGADDSPLPRYAASWGFFSSNAFLWTIAVFSLVWLCAIAYASVTLWGWTRSVWTSPPPRLRIAARIVGALAAVALSVAVLRVGMFSLFPVTNLLSLAPDPTYALLVLAIVTIALAVTKMILLGTAAFRRRD